MKFSIVSKAVVPDVSLIDPETTLSMDPFLSACTGIDALVHAIEAFVSTGHGPLTDPPCTGGDAPDQRQPGADDRQPARHRPT
jgi:Alcohol dehydrogenase, class IV